MAKAFRRCKIAYIGNDVAYLNRLKKEYEEHCEEFEFHYVELPQVFLDNINEIFNALICEKADIIYIDFSLELNASYFLTKKLINFNETNTKCIVALVDSLDSNEKIKMLNLSGAKLCYIKSGEIFDSIYGPISISFPNETRNPDFVKARIGEKIQIKVDQPIVFIKRNSLFIETDFEYRKGEKYQLIWDSEGIVKSDKFEARNVKEFDVLSDKKYLVEFKIIFVEKMSLRKQRELIRLYENPYSGDDEFDPIDIEPVSLEEENEISPLLKFNDSKDELVNDLESIDLNTIEDDEELDSEVLPSKELLKGMRRKFQHWLNLQQDKLSSVKDVKVLIVSKSFSIFKEIPAEVDKLNFYIRYYSNLDDPNETIRKFRPDIVFFHYEGESNHINDQENKFNFNGDGTIREMIASSLFIDGYDPFFLISGANNLSSKELMDKFECAQIIAGPMKITYSLIESFVGKIRERKQGRLKSLAEKKMNQLKLQDKKKYRELTVDHFIEENYFVASFQEHSYVSTIHYVENIILTESEIYFTSNLEIPMYTLLRMDIPFPIFFTVVPMNAKSKRETIKGSLRAIIHSISEADKQHLRRFVNEVYGDKGKLSQSKVTELTKKFLKGDKILTELEQLERKIEK